MTCRGRCSHAGPDATLDGIPMRRAIRFNHLYEHGYASCRHCRVFFQTTAVFCPCCSRRLSRRPRNPKRAGQRDVPRVE